MLKFGGELIRSVGGWSAVKALRKASVLQKGDERILDDGEFVKGVLSEAKKELERKYRLAGKGVDLDFIADTAAKIIGLNPNLFSVRPQSFGDTEHPLPVASLLEHLGAAPLAKRHDPLLVARGAKVAIQYRYHMNCQFAGELQLMQLSIIVENVRNPGMRPQTDYCCEPLEHMASHPRALPAFEHG